MAEPFPFELVSPERQLLSGEATRAVVPGGDGQFTALKDHAAMVSTLRPGILDVSMASGENHRVFVRGGFADINPNGLTILAEQATPVAEIDMADIDQSISDAKDDVNDATDDDLKSAAQERLDQLREVRDVLAAEV